MNNGYCNNIDKMTEPDSTTSDLMDDDSSYDQMILDSLNSSTVLNKLETIEDVDRIIDEESYDLPKSLIITNIDSRVFNENSIERIQFEDSFRQLDSMATILYFKSFRRARVDFSMPQAASKARILCDQMKIGDESINCYYAEVCEIVSNVLLQPPALEKQFLISPPASPPEGWAPVEEAQPVLNIDLQSALANLVPGSAHELHPASDHHPGIVVHTCADTRNLIPKVETTIVPDNQVTTSVSGGDIDDDDQMKPKVKIPHTACPPAMMQNTKNK